MRLAACVGRPWKSRTRLVAWCLLIGAACEALVVAFVVFNDARGTVKGPWWGPRRFARFTARCPDGLARRANWYEEFGAENWSVEGGLREIGTTPGEVVVRAPSWAFMPPAGCDAGITTAMGWPWRCLKLEEEGRYVPAGGGFNFSVTRRGVGIDPAPGKAGQLLVPLLPIWGGMAADVALFGAGAAGVVFGFATLRAWRRRRAGRCAACGYDLRGSVGACPECGRRLYEPRAQARGQEEKDKEPSACAEARKCNLRVWPNDPSLTLRARCEPGSAF